MTWRNCSGVSRVAGTAVPMPALLTSTSTRPNSSIGARRRAPCTASGSATSVCDGERPAAGRLDERRGLLEPVDAAGAERDVGAGLGEGLANATPSPEEAPVTMATLPSRRNRSRTVMRVAAFRRRRRAPVTGARPYRLGAPSDEHAPNMHGLGGYVGE